MNIETIGHASLIIRNDQNKPVLLTDPWLIGSVYWRSWWLQNYPTDKEIEELKDVKYCYVTHEHPDHYHTASIRKLGKNPTYISPLLPQDNISTFLGSQGNKTKSLNPFTWYKIEDDISILSIPLLNDDSCLIINTPKAVIINLNDAKPAKAQLARLQEFISKNLSGKKIVVLSSYSPASIVNSFRKDSKFVAFKDKSKYIEYINGIVDVLNADYFIPFASQVIFYRPDSEWANEYKVSYDDINKGWKAKKTKLLPPYSKLDLNTFEHSFIKPENYNHDPQWIKEKVEKHMQQEANVNITDEDIKKIEKKMRSQRAFLSVLFPKGIGFITNKREFTFKPLSGKITEGLSKNHGFAIKVPDQALKDAIEYGHFGDLGITMFTILILNRSSNPKLIYVFFILLTLHDYKHTMSLSNFFKWTKSSAKNYKWKFPKIDKEVSLLTA
jgi:hypothetical protein